MKIYAIMREGKFIAAFDNKEFAHEQAKKNYEGVVPFETMEVRMFTDEISPT